MTDVRTALLGLVPACRALRARSQLVVRAAPGSFLVSGISRYFSVFITGLKVKNDIKLKRTV